MTNHETYSAGDVFTALRKVFDQHAAGQPLTWTGPDRLHFSVAATCLSPSEAFSQKNLDYALEDQGQDFLDAFMAVCFQIGFHNGVMRQSETTEHYERLFESYRDAALDQREKVKTLAQAIHEMRRALGFDVDGDATPDAEIAGMGVEAYARSAILDAMQHRQDYEEALDHAHPLFGLPLTTPEMVARRQSVMDKARAKLARYKNKNKES